MPTTRSKSNQDVLAALSDVVTVAPSPEKSRYNIGQESFSSAEFSGQSPMKSMEAPPSVPTKDPFDPVGASRNGRNSNKDAPAPAAKGGMSKFSQAFKRHTPEEKEAKRREKEKRMNKAIDDSTMKSSRMDIIDRMDLSGINGNSLFHHDSPYDACSPHSNRNTRRAPVMAFDHTIDPMTGQPIGMRATNRPNLSPLAAATMRKMDDNDNTIEDQKYASPRANFNGPIPTLRMDSSESGNMLSSNTDDATSVASHSTTDRDVDAERAYRQNNYYNKPTKGFKAKSDMANPNADIWGVSSEPWQDFASPAGTRGGLRPKDSRGKNGRHSGDSGSGTTSAASSVFDMEAVMTGKKPTPKPNPNEGSSSLSQDTSASTTPKRSKSLIKKIRSARQNPNVPPSDDELELSSLSISGDSTGRARAASGSTAVRRPGHGHSPSTPPVVMRGVSSPNVRSNDSNLVRSGTLKARGSENSSGSYYRRGNESNSNSTESSPQGATGLGRNGSIFGRFLSGKNRERGEVYAR